jgi:hypothetical protein
MAWLDAYATAAEYRNRIDKSITTDDAAILIGLTAISRTIERELGGAQSPRVFNQSGASEVRYFPYRLPARQGHVILIDDFVTLNEVASDTDGNGTWETVAAVGDCIPWPYNAAIHSFPYTGLELKHAPSVTVGGYAKALRVTATYGWPSVPTPIKEATIQIAAVLRIESPRAEATVSELGQLVQASRESQGIIHRLLKPYDRRRLSV